MPTKKHHAKLGWRDISNENANIEQNPIEEDSYNGSQPRSRRGAVPLFEFLGPNLLEINANDNSAEVDVKRILSRGQKEPTSQVSFKPTDADFPTVGSMPNRKIKTQAKVAVDVGVATGASVGTGAVFDPRFDDGFPTLGSMQDKPQSKVANDAKQMAVKADDIASGVQTEVAAEAAPAAAVAVVTPRATQSAIVQQIREQMAPAKPYQNRKTYNNHPGPGSMERQASNTTLPRHGVNAQFNASFRRMPQAQIRPPAPASMVMNRSSPLLHATPRPSSLPVQRSALSLPVQRPPHSLYMNRPPAPIQTYSTHRLSVQRSQPSLPQQRPPPALDARRTPAAMPMNRTTSSQPPRGHLLPTPSRSYVAPPPRASRPIVRHVSDFVVGAPRVTSNSFVGHRPGFNENAFFVCNQPPLKTSLNCHAAEFRPSYMMVNEPMPEPPIEPRGRKKSMTERRRRQRFYRTLKPNVMFGIGEVPPDLPQMMPRPIHLPAQVAQGTGPRSSFNPVYESNRRNNFPRGQA
ncbi:bromodomain-containing protein 4-like [Drosophila sulfurigaster albostrigata]|uniref:bromodomain-containing protein 4-like n=1 Tax=Drosophila sulfurigaster albostrigata TaxID=89887 RepID=UPI002D21BF49|nr:bromodomain-containing protein 4-like [Drosophila sulfurigaster albostrigata]